MTINVLKYKDHEINISVTKNEVTWTTTLNGENYGNAVILPSKKMDTLIGTIGTIIINSIETIEKLCEQKNTSKK